MDSTAEMTLVIVILPRQEKYRNTVSAILKAHK